MTERWSVKTWKGKDEGEAEGEDLVGVRACVSVCLEGVRLGLLLTLLPSNNHAVSPQRQR